MLLYVFSDLRHIDLGLYPVSRKNGWATDSREFEKLRGFDRPTQRNTPHTTNQPRQLSPLQSQLRGQDVPSAKDDLFSRCRNVDCGLTTTVDDEFDPGGFKRCAPFFEDDFVRRSRDDTAEIGTVLIGYPVGLLPFGKYARMMESVIQEVRRDY